MLTVLATSTDQYSLNECVSMSAKLIVFRLLI